MRKATFSLLAALMLTAGTAVTPAAAQSQGTAPDIFVAVSPAKDVFRVDEPLVMSVSVVNGGGDLYVTRGFMASEFHRTLVFTGPDGAPIRVRMTGPEPTPPPPFVLYRFVDPSDPLPQPFQVDPVELVAGGWAGGGGPFDGHGWYDLTKAGLYSVKTEVYLRTYPADKVTPGPAGGPVAEINSSDWADKLESEPVYFTLVADADGDGYSTPIAFPPWGSQPDCDDGNRLVNPGATEVIGNGRDDDCNPLTLDRPGVLPGAVVVQADLHTVGTGNYPGSSKQGIPGMKLKLYDPGSPCVRALGTSWQSHESIWGSCTYIPLGPPPGVPTTDGSGGATLQLPPGSYFLLGEHSDPAAPVKRLFIGRSIDGLASGETRKQYFQVILKADNKKVPAKYTVKTGSELLIIEPEYVEWSGTKELYPFVFDSVGDWAVTTAIAPPEGFVADKRSLTEAVNSEIEAMQFTIVDVGSDWVDTTVTHAITHKGRTEIVKSKVGVKLTKKLADKKKLTRFGKPLPGVRR